MVVSFASLSPQGFDDDSNGIIDPEDDYAYDGFGNMTTDQNKGITNILYNHLSLPAKILFGSETRKIEYLYAAGGKKVRKAVKSRDLFESGLVDYLDGFQYKDGNLQFFPTSDGYIRATDVNGTIAYSYVYNYTDHLGNIRLSYAKDPENPNVLKILEEDHYYPFGLKHTNYNSDLLVHREYRGALGIKDPVTPEPLVPVLPYNYKYNGKELQNEMGLGWHDYGARNYDPALGRWMNIDPLAEKSRRFSPYAYALNNPVYFIDPDGMKAEASQTAKIYYDWDENGYRTQDGDESTFEEAMSDNDCPSCRTKEDWAAYYQQAENTAAMVGEKSAWSTANRRLTMGTNEESRTIFYLDGELMDLRRYNNRAHAFGSLLEDTALIDPPSKVFKALINALTK